MSPADWHHAHFLPSFPLSPPVCFSISSSKHPTMSVGSDNHITFSITSIQGGCGLDGNAAVGRDWESLSVFTANIHGTPFRRFSIGGTGEPRQGVMQTGQAPRGLSDPADTPGNGPVKNEYVWTGASLTRPGASARYCYAANACLMRPMHSQL